MKVKVCLILISFVLALPAMAQKADFEKFSPSSIATIMATAMEIEGHPVSIEAEWTKNGWNFNIDLKLAYTDKTMPGFLAAMIGAVYTGTRWTRWRSNRVYISTGNLKFAWITTKACRDIGRKLERNEIDGIGAMKLLDKEMHIEFIK